VLLPQPVWLTPSTLDYLANRQGLSLPATLRPEPLWRDEEELRALAEQATRELGEQGLLDRGAPSVELVIALRALCAGDEECYAYVATDEKSSRLHAAASGTDRVFAQLSVGAEKVQLRDAKADTVVDEIAGELEPCPPANEQTITCRVSELTAPTTGIAVERTLTREAKRMKALHGKDVRKAEVKLMVAIRDSSGRRHTSGSRSPVLLDVEPGKRWITYLTGTPEDLYLNARGADRAVIVEHVARELSLLRSEHG
jgi:hypothetical protein